MLRVIIRSCLEKRAQLEGLGLGCGLLLALSASASAVPQGTAFTYQGRLEDGGSPANGVYNMAFRLFDAAAGGAPIGGLLSIPNVNVVDGLFTVSLDFGATPFGGQRRWLEIAVNGTTLSPRQELTASPYALFALNTPSQYWTANGNHIYKTNSGFIGIGTTSPDALLHLSSGVQEVARFTYVSSIPPFSLSNLHFGFYSSGADLSADVLDPITLNMQSEGDVLLAGGGGNVGIGTTVPTNQLHVYEGSAGAITAITDAPLVVENAGRTYINLLSPDADEQGILFGNPGDGHAAGGVIYNNSVTPDGLQLRTNGNVTQMAITSAGNVGIGTTTPAAKLDVAGGNGSYVRVDATYGDLHFNGGSDGVFGLINDTAGPGARIEMHINSQPMLTVLADGTTRVKVLEITGADVAEKFPTSEEPEAVKPGMVMEIDPANSGKLRIARGAYTRRVAGVVSGGGDLSVGAILGNLPGCEDAPPIALSGRVWVHCDASADEIQPGDLLTTSDTPGHAMAAADRERSHGAIIGKAMTTLKQGETGLVLVLISLQ